MKKILTKSYLCLIYVFFALFLLIIRMDSNEHPLIYSIGLIIASIFVAVIPFFTNHCKKIAVRKFYLISTISISFSVLLVAISYLLVNVISDSETLMSIRSWVIRISQAVFITSSLYTTIYAFKDLFKKDYSIEIFDIQSFQMVVNLLTYIAIYYVMFDYGEPQINYLMNGFNGGVNEYVLKFNDFTTIRNYLLIISGAYIAIYIVLEVVKYLKFEKKDKGSNNRYN